MVSGQLTYAVTCADFFYAPTFAAEGTLTEIK
jgi:hypothetical protein